MSQPRNAHRQPGAAHGNYETQGDPGRTSPSNSPPLQTAGSSLSHAPSFPDSQRPFLGNDPSAAHLYANGENVAVELGRDGNRSLNSGALHWALNRMVKADHAARTEEASNRNCCRTFCMCGCLVDFFKFWESQFGFKETEEELDMLLAAMPESERKQLCETAVRVYRRQRWLGESNFVVMTDPSQPGGEKLPVISIIRMSRDICSGTSMRRVSLDARYITQVELRDDWAKTELLIEILVFVFSIISWIVLFQSDVESDSEERRRDFMLYILSISIIFLAFVIMVNYINTTFFRGVRLVIDTCTPGIATVVNRTFADKSHHTENTATATAHQHVVTMTALFAMEARQHLQLWKHMGDNRRLALDAASKGGANAAQPDEHLVAQTGNFAPFKHVCNTIPEAKVAKEPSGPSGQGRIGSPKRGVGVGSYVPSHGGNDQDKRVHSHV